LRALRLNKVLPNADEKSLEKMKADAKASRRELLGKDSL